MTDKPPELLLLLLLLLASDSLSHTAFTQPKYHQQNVTNILEETPASGSGLFFLTAQVS